MPRRYKWASDDDTYRTTHLHYGGVHDTRRDDTYRTPHLQYEGHAPSSAVLTGESPKAGGNALPARASDASTVGWRADGKPAETFAYGEAPSRHMAKLRQGFHPEGARWNESLPPIHPKPEPTYVERHSMQIKQATKHSLIHPISQSRSVKHSLAVPLPTSTHLRLMSWNVEGLKETAKYDSVLRFCSSNKFSLLCAQETKVESSHTFVQNGWEILMSGLITLLQASWGRFLCFSCFTFTC